MTTSSVVETDSQLRNITKGNSNFSHFPEYILLAQNITKLLAFTKRPDSESSKIFFSIKDFFSFLNKSELSLFLITCVFYFFSFFLSVQSRSKNQTSSVLGRFTFGPVPVSDSIRKPKDSFNI